MNMGTCIHYTGALNFGNPREHRCKAGVCYWAAFDGDRPGMMLRLPCIQFLERPANRIGTRPIAGEPVVHQEIDRRGEVAISCEHVHYPTQEEVDAQRSADDASLARVFAAIKAASAWRVKGRPEQDRNEVVECPSCHGRLHMHQSAYNGHCRGQCETPGCVSWME